LHIIFFILNQLVKEKKISAEKLHTGCITSLLITIQDFLVSGVSPAAGGAGLIKQET